MQVFEEQKTILNIWPENKSLYQTDNYISGIKVKNVNGKVSISWESVKGAANYSVEVYSSETSLTKTYTTRDTNCVLDIRWDRVDSPDIYSGFEDKYYHVEMKAYNYYGILASGSIHLTIK